MPDAFIYQILYPSAAALDPGFAVLDNSSNERPDWYEYWPIRRYLLSEPLDEAAFYGFVSPKFKQKTNLSAAEAHAVVARQPHRTDVVLLSPSLQLTAYHWNVFEYGESVHPGLLAVATEFFSRIGRATDLASLVTHSGIEVYSNFMIAKPRFWRAWLEVTEELFALAESSTDPLGAALREPTSYRGRREVQMKIFILERIATWLLAVDPTFKVRTRDPFAARSRIYKLPGAIVCDALKMAHVANPGRGQYKVVFGLVSRYGKLLSVDVRVGALLGLKPVRACLAALAAVWGKAGTP